MPGIAATDNSLPAAAWPPRVASPRHCCGGRHRPHPRTPPSPPCPRSPLRARLHPRRMSPSTTGSRAIPPQAGARRHDLAGRRRTARALDAGRGHGAELDPAMSLHVAGAIHYGLGRHADAIPVLERAVAVITSPAPEPPADGEAADDQQE
ncbi:unnamed protein product [Urochloa humidicola]